MIWSSVNFDLFMVRYFHRAGLQYQMEELSAVRAVLHLACGDMISVLIKQRWTTRENAPLLRGVGWL